jgi:hypothetical protein
MLNSTNIRGFFMLMVQLEQIQKVKEQVQAEYRKEDYLHAEFIEFEVYEKHPDTPNEVFLKVKDTMGWMTIPTIKWLDDKYGAGIVFGGNPITGDIAPYVIVE